MAAGPGQADEVTTTTLVDAWRRGEFDALEEIEGQALEQHPQRPVLSLVRLASALERADLAAARAAADAAGEFGVARSAVLAVMVAAVHRDLMRARESQARPEDAASHRARAAALVADLGAGAVAPTAPATAGGDTRALRDEVLRLRRLVDAYRAGGDADVSRQDGALVNRIRGANLTYLSRAKMLMLARTVRAIEEQSVPGVFIDAGCALGGSSILIASTKRASRELEVYDVFGMIPPPSENDPADVHERYRRILDGQAKGLGEDPYYGYEIDLLRVVRDNFRRFNVDPDAGGVRLVQGLVQDTLTNDGPVAFAHVDLDWHDPVQVCLERIYPRLSVGGSIIADDYHDWEGCRIAVDAFIAANRDSLALDDSARSMKLTRVRQSRPLPELGS